MHNQSILFSTYLSIPSSSSGWWRTSLLQGVPGYYWCCLLQVHFFRWWLKSTSIYILCLSVCLLVCFGLFLSNKLKMAAPMGPKMCGGPCITPGKVSGWSTFQKYASNKNLSLNLENPRNYFYKISEIFIVVLQYIQRENVHNRRWAWNALKASSIIQTMCCVRIKKMHIV